MAALHRAVAFEKMHHVAVPVGENLHLDMARRLDVALEQHLVVAEGGKRLALRLRKRVVEFDDAPDAPHAAPAAARNRLDQHRIADLVGLLLQEIGVLSLAAIARHHRHAGKRHQSLGVGLRTHRAYRGRRRPDEDQPHRRRRFREGSVLRQKAVARMDRLDARGNRRRDDPLDGEIAVAGRPFSYRDICVGLAPMRPAAVRLRHDRNGADAEAARRADDATGDLATVGNEKRLQHSAFVAWFRARDRR